MGKSANEKFKFWKSTHSLHVHKYIYGCIHFYVQCGNSTISIEKVVYNKCSNTKNKLDKIVGGWSKFNK